MSDTRRRAYRVAYDGTAYRGFQRQPDVKTVSDTILRALEALDVPEAGVPPGYAAAGRTDAGVSALAQTVAFDAPPWLSPAAINGDLPGEVRVWASADVPYDFHATHDATRRAYTYYLHAPSDDIERAQAVLDGLTGTHDFHNLTPDDDGTVRTLDGEITADGQFLVIRVAADGFPRQLVRRLVTVIDRVARGAAKADLVARVLSDDMLSGPDGIPPAPPEPLVLAAVTYPGVDFTLDDDAAATARRVFRERHERLAARARVSNHLSDGIGR